MEPIPITNVEASCGVDTRGARADEAILETDREPASFWIANPANTLTGNVAAGGDGNGFWYSLSPHPTGPSATSAIWPRRANLGGFADNVAHSNGDNGLFVDILRNPPGVTEAPNYTPALTADFQSFTAYKNRKRGAWLRGTNLRLSNAVIADNSIGVTFAGANAILRDSRVVGTTGNETGPPKPDDPAFPIRGFEFYDGQVGVERTVFANFVPDAHRAASALSELRFSPFFTDPTNFARTLSFQNALPVFFEPQTARRDKLGADGYRGSVFRDLDGSVTGTAGASVAVDTPLILGPGDGGFIYLGGNTYKGTAATAVGTIDAGVQYVNKGDPAPQMFIACVSPFAGAHNASGVHFPCADPLQSTFSEPSLTLVSLNVLDEVTFVSKTLTQAVSANDGWGPGCQPISPTSKNCSVKRNEGLGKMPTTIFPDGSYFGITTMPRILISAPMEGVYGGTLNPWSDSTTGSCPQFSANTSGAVVVPNSNPTGKESVGLQSSGYNPPSISCVVNGT
jgi:hypothetical protein